MKINYLTKAIATIGLAGSLALSGCVSSKENFPIMDNYPQLKSGLGESENYSEKFEFCYSESNLASEQAFEICNYETEEPAQFSKPVKTYEDRLSDLEEKAIKVVPSGRCEFVYFCKSRINEAISDGTFTLDDLTALDIFLGGYLKADKEILQSKIPYTAIEEEIRKRILPNYPFLIEDNLSKRKINISYPALNQLSEEEFLVMKNLGYAEGKEKLLIKDLARIYEDIQKILEIKNRDKNREDCGVSNDFLQKTKELFQSDLIKIDNHLKDSSLNKRISVSFIELLNPDIFFGFGRNKKLKYDDTLRTIIGKPDNSNWLTNYSFSDIKLPMKFPTWTLLLTAPLGAIGPFLRSTLLSKYVKRKYDGIDLTENIINGLLGSIILDSLHPLVYPLRLGIPILFEPIRKLTGWRKLEKQNEK